MTSWARSRAPVGRPTDDLQVGLSARERGERGAQKHLILSDEHSDRTGHRLIHGDSPRPHTLSSANSRPQRQRRPLYREAPELSGQSGCASTSGGDDGSRSRAQPQPRPSRRHGEPGRPHRQERAPGPPAWTTATSPRYRAGHGAGRRIPASYPLGRMNAAQGRSTASSTTSTRRRCRRDRGPVQDDIRARPDRAGRHRPLGPPCNCGSRRFWAAAEVRGPPRNSRLRHHRRHQ